ncbi:hypothetical protein [Xanthomonas phage MET23-P3]|nr:hypothetical protein [Xanthomonas phage MET23-P3]
MDKSAIEAIQDSSAAAAKATQEQIPAGIQHLVAVPNGVTLQNVEASLAGRTRFRGKLVTSSIPDFVTYVKNREGGHGFIDTDKLGATVFFNLGDADKPGHADHTARLTLQATPAYLAMLAAGGKAFSQRDALDFIEDWSHLIGAHQVSDDGAFSPIPLARAIAAIRKVKIKAESTTEQTEGNFQQSRSVLESVAASSDEGLPDVLSFRTEPYLGLPERTFHMRVSVSTTGREPSLRFRVIALEQEQDEIAKQFKALLLGEVGESASMTIGTFTP